MPNFKQGEDIKITLDLKKAGANVDVSAAQQIKAILKIDGVEQYKYALNADTGYGELIIDPVNNYQIHILAERGHTSTFETGVVKAYVVADIPNEDFTDNFQAVEFGPFIVGRCNVGETKDEALL